MTGNPPDGVSVNRDNNRRDGCPPNQHAIARESRPTEAQQRDDLPRLHTTWRVAIEHRKPYRNHGKYFSLSLTHTQGAPLRELLKIFIGSNANGFCVQLAAVRIQ